MRYTPKKALDDVVGICGCSDNVEVVGEKVVVMNSLTLPDNADWASWIKALRFAAFFNQLGRCVCNKALGDDVQLHHALLSRSDLVGIRDKKKNTILHHTYNVILCHPDCHEKLTRRAGLEFLKRIYGSNVLLWYNSIPAEYMRGRRSLLE